MVVNSTCKWLARLGATRGIFSKRNGKRTAAAPPISFSFFTVTRKLVTKL